MPETTPDISSLQEIEQLWSRFASRYSAETGMPYASAAHKSWLELSKLGEVRTDPAAAIKKMRLLQEVLDMACLSNDEIVNAQRRHQEQLYGRLLTRLSTEEAKNPTMANGIRNKARRQFKEDANSLPNQIEVLKNLTQDLDEESLIKPT